MPGLEAAILERCLALRPKERFVVVTDELYDRGIPASLVAAATAAGAQPTVASIPSNSVARGTVPEEFYAGLAKADVVVLCTATLFPHDSRRRLAVAGCRVLSLSGISRDTYLRACSVNHDELARETLAAAQAVRGAREVRLLTSSGTDLSATLRRVDPVALTGLAREAGTMAVLPAGVVAMIPEAARGRVVVDGSIEGFGLCGQAVTLEVDVGRVVEVRGAAVAGDVRSRLVSGDANSAVVAEIGFGTNPGAVYCGNILEDERVAGSCHIGLGRNRHLGGDVESVTHFDVTLRRPTLWVDDRLVVDQGHLCLAT